MSAHSGSSHFQRVDDLFDHSHLFIADHIQVSLKTRVSRGITPEMLKYFQCRHILFPRPSTDRAGPRHSSAQVYTN